MKTSHHRWLLAQLPLWEGEGLISTQGANQLRERYGREETGIGLAQMAMGALGALLIGSGLIAVVGYNWDDLSRPVRLLLAFLPLLLTQGFTAFVLKRGEALATWVRETAGLLQSLALGACMAMVSQIYNMGGEWRDFLFYWMILSVPLAWVLRSHSVVILYLIGIAEWSVHDSWRHTPWQQSPLMYPLLLLGLLPYWPGLNGKASLSTAVRWVMALSAMTGFNSAAAYATDGLSGSAHTSAFFWMWALNGAVLILLPLTSEGIDEPLGRKPQVILGSIWLLGYGTVMTYLDRARYVIEGVEQTVKLPWCWGLLFVLALCLVHAIKNKRWAVISVAGVALLPLLCLLTDHSGGLLSWLTLLYLSALGITLIVLDFVGKRGAPRMGAALLCILIIGRMIDSDLSLLAKGIAFIAVGVAFLAFNVFMTKQHRAKSTLPNP